MSDSEILCPQPSRYLKRKASQLIKAVDDTSSDRVLCKRQKHSSSPPDNIHHWLEDLPPTLHRCCSDSFLVHNTKLRQQAHSIKMPRSKTTLPNTGGGPLHWPLTPQSLQAAPRPYTPISAEISADVEAPIALDTVSQSLTQASSCSDPKDELKKRNRVQSPSYRDELQIHCVHIDSYTNSTPECVQMFAQNLVKKERSSPDLTEKELLSIREELSELPNADEGTTRQGFDAAKLFPTRKDYKNKLAIGSGVPFDQTALPFTRGYNLPPIVTPKPDLQYGYSRDSFTITESAVMRHNRLNAVSHPTTATYWPFFVAEFKSGSRGGTRWVAENQNAGTGCHCVNSMETLLKYTRKQDLPRQIIDSLAFSCVADADFGSLWVHWLESETDNGPRRFVSSEVDSYLFKKPADLRQFRASVRNIIEYGINERLPIIKEALANCLPLIPLWNAEDRLAKVRRRASTSQIVNEDTGSGASQESRIRL